MIYGFVTEIPLVSFTLYIPIIRKNYYFCRFTSTWPMMRPCRYSTRHAIQVIIKMINEFFYCCNFVKNRNFLVLLLSIIWTTIKFLNNNRFFCFKCQVIKLCRCFTRSTRGTTRRQKLRQPARKFTCRHSARATACRSGQTMACTTSIICQCTRSSAAHGVASSTRRYRRYVFFFIILFYFFNFNNKKI